MATFQRMVEPCHWPEKNALGGCSLGNPERSASPDQNQQAKGTCRHEQRQGLTADPLASRACYQGPDQAPDAPQLSDMRIGADQ
ncbi:hypothetical protein ALO43_200173 [Pseudomonas tremae]|uniref:Uncharacterized protein n=1 Tax=Pseudomonas tremae TaxID=200454 RepID=A0AA40TYB2_9PSED|nr:hypothetical protein ALO43_200173 [Pseudomonas tremae]